MKRLVFPTSSPSYQLTATQLGNAVCQQRSHTIAQLGATRNLACAPVSDYVFSDSTCLQVDVNLSKIFFYAACGTPTVPYDFVMSDVTYPILRVELSFYKLFRLTLGAPIRPACTEQASYISVSLSFHH